MKDPGRRGHEGRPYNHRSRCKTPKSIKLSAQQSLALTFPRTHLSVHRRAAGICGSRNTSGHCIYSHILFFLLPTYVYLKRPWVFPCVLRTVDLVPWDPVCHLCVLHFPPCTQGKMQDTSVTGPAQGLHMPKTVTYRWLFPNWTLAHTRHHTATPSCNLKVTYRVRSESYTIHNPFLLSWLCLQAEEPNGELPFLWRSFSPMNFLERTETAKLKRGLTKP